VADTDLRCVTLVSRLALRDASILVPPGLSGARSADRRGGRGCECG
jgi:hypothetical protein